jgi:hypothetical protein
LDAELSALRAELALPDNFRNIERYQELTKILAVEVVNTPRDIGRLVGTFHALAGMLRNEVDWIDLLAYCSLLTKAPQTIEIMRLRPDEFSDDVFSGAALVRRMTREKQPAKERLDGLIKKSENDEGIRQVIGFLFPALSEGSRQSHADRRDALHHRRPLLTTLRLGLLPGDYSTAAVETLLLEPSDDVERAIRNAYEGDTLAQLIDRLNDVYPKIPKSNHVSFWKGVGQFLKKRDCEWITSYSPMHEVVWSFAEMLEKAVLRDEAMQPIATTIFSNLYHSNEDELTAHWLRSQIFRHGLFGNQRRASEAAILDISQADAIARDLSQRWRTEHLSGKLLPCRWDLMPVYTMINTGVWDDLCRKGLDGALSDDHALDAFTLMLYGAHYSTDRAIVEKMCNYEMYIGYVKERLKSEDIHETVRTALTKAGGRGW